MRILKPAGAAIFGRMAALGRRLIDLHLLRSPELDPPAARFEGAGDATVGRGRAGVRYDAAHERVCINAAQHFAPVPAAVWQYRVGGYPVCEKWLKDRQERRLTLETFAHRGETFAQRGCRPCAWLRGERHSTRAGRTDGPLRDRRSRPGRRQPA